MRARGKRPASDSPSAALDRSNAAIGLFWLVWIGVGLSLGLTTGTGLSAAAVGLVAALICVAVADRLLPLPDDDRG